MNKRRKIVGVSFVVLAMIAVFIYGCKKDTKSPVTNGSGGGTSTEINNYLAAGSYGDLIKYSIDKGKSKISYTNETTNTSGSYDYNVSTNPNLNGIYQITDGSKNYYGIELNKKTFLTSIPSGNLFNLLSFGVYSDVNLKDNYTKEQLAGKYIFIIYNHENDEEVYGGYELKSDGSFTWQFGPNEPNNFNENSHFSGGGTGTWSVSTADPSRIVIKENSNVTIGTLYPGKIMLIDNGVGKGFTLGLKYPDSPVTQSSIAGKYKFMDFNNDGEVGVGHYNIPSNGGNLNYYYRYNGQSGEGTGNSTDFSKLSSMKNVFKCTSYYENDPFKIYFVLLPGEMFLHFVVAEEGLISYGIGSKID